MRRLLYISLLSLVLTCIFDPADKILHFKVQLFGLCWVLFVFYVFVSNTRLNLPYQVSFYLLLMLIVPIISITYYMLMNGGEPYDGFQYLKSYLFVTIVVVLYISKINLIKTLCSILTLLSCAIIVIFIITLINPVLLGVMYHLGLEYGNINLGQRIYGGITFPTIFYKTSPMIAVSIAYYVYQSMIAHRSKQLQFILLSIVNIVAMFLAGTRNNILMSLGLPLLILFWYARHKLAISFLIILMLTLISISYSDTIADMFSPSDTSNDIKLRYLGDYERVFSDPQNLLIGQGLGSFNYWDVLSEKTSVTELTYLEIFRNYGLILGITILLLVLYPLKELFNKRNLSSHYLTLGYASYLVMSVSNPFFFSSSGMLILSIVITSLFLQPNNKIQQSGFNGERVIHKQSVHISAV